MENEELAQKVTDAMSQAFDLGKDYQRNRLIFLLNNDPVINAWFTPTDIEKILDVVANG